MLCDAKKYGTDDSVLYFLIDFIIARFAKSTSEKTEILFLRWMGKGVEEVGMGLLFGRSCGTIKILMKRAGRRRMIRLLDLQKQFLDAHIRLGDNVADFTMGNGHDTLYLAQRVGPNGHVYAFDIQPDALESTRRRLTENGVEQRVTLILDSHANASGYIDVPLRAGVFNLGWLPGSADKTVTTKRDSTRQAVQSAMQMLDHDGILLIAVYPGHQEGYLEGQMLSEMFADVDRYTWCVTRVQIVNASDSPYFFTLERK